MAKPKSSNRNCSVHSSSKSLVSAGSGKVIRFIIALLVSVLLLAGIVAAVIKYYRIATNR